MRLSNIALAITAIYGGFSPANLFAGGVAGAWYDPSDLSTMFDSSAGTTPVAMPGQGAPVPVGLMLDKSQGLVLGPELVTNGDFSSGTTTGWSPNGTATPTLSVVSEELKVSIASATAQIRAVQTLTLVSGKTYKVVGTTRRVVGDNTFLRITSSSDGSATGQLTFSVNTSTSNNEIQLIFTANATTLYLVLGVGMSTGTANLDGFFDNISVRELPGNHAIAFNNLNARPVLMARVNLLEYSEQFDNAYWSKTNVTVTPNTAVAPDGATTADTLTENATSGSFLILNTPLTVVANTAITFSVCAKYSNNQWFRLLVSDTSAENILGWFDIQNGIKGNISSSAGATNPSSSITSLGNGWYRCSVTVTLAGTLRTVSINNVAGDGSNTRVNNGASFIWGADFRPANIGANVPAYQRIADALTYDTNGFPLYLYFDGTDDSMYTPASIPFATVTSDGQARRNLLSYPTQFDDVAWVKQGFLAFGSGSVANTTATLDPLGGNTADLLVEDTANSFHSAQSSSVSGTAGTTYTLSRYVKAASGSRWFMLALDESTANHLAFGHFQPSTNTVGTSGTTGAQWTSVSFTRTDVGNGWYRLVLTATLTNAATITDLSRFKTANGGVSIYTGDGTSGMYWWGAQLETGSTATAFQNIGTDKVAVFAGVRRLTNTSGCVTELTSGTTNGFNLFASTIGGNSWFFSSFGTSQLYGTVAPYNAPITNVLTEQLDKAALTDATRISARVNAAAVSLSYTGSLGTPGNFANAPLYIGARGGNTIALNGHLHSLIIAGSAVSAGNISATEQWVAGKTGIQI